MKKFMKALKIILLIFGYAGVIYTLLMTRIWYENHGSAAMLLRIWFPVLCGLLGVPGLMWTEWAVWRELKTTKTQPAERMISYDAVIAALDSLRGDMVAQTLWELGYDEAVAQMYDFVECIEREART